VEEEARSISELLEAEAQAESGGTEPGGIKHHGKWLGVRKNEGQGGGIGIGGGEKRGQGTTEESPGAIARSIEGTYCTVEGEYLDNNHEHLTTWNKECNNVSVATRMRPDGR
jgi:hypothetical protein